MVAYIVMRFIAMPNLFQLAAKGVNRTAPRALARTGAKAVEGHGST